MATLAIKARVVGCVDDAHAAGPELGDDAIRAEVGARREGHGGPDNSPVIPSAERGHAAQARGEWWPRRRTDRPVSTEWL